MGNTDRNGPEEEDCFRGWTGTVLRVHVTRRRGDTEYLGFNINPNTGEALGLGKGDVVKVLMRTQAGELEVFNRSVGKARNGQFNVYIPKPVSDELGLGKGDLVDVFLKKV